ncbi:MAG: hypothetical protein Q8O35_01130 [Humidesulfovibrio sp.]|uniref:L,D-transpeptidase family protein n=1 Tax=Humidesulfovibrio sp. TaxID=2910988 RepID=UPI002735C53D|nr:hypothetical protein [Humidesulfovibrio sp.]MDP2846774.1 hypothetical protein [Humidesulfovibrio sp.]
MSLRSLLIAVALLSLVACAPKPVPLGGADLTRPALQLLLVVAEDWQYTETVLQRFERSSPDAAWARVGQPLPVNLGRSGLGWGRGLHGQALGAGPVKREGDGRAPAGLFGLGVGFAQDPAEVGAARLPLLRTDATLFCVDDAASPQYNQIVQTGGKPAAWRSAEDMVRTDGQYRLGVFVRHNTDPVEPGAGSCIFLHIWPRQGVASSGCTSMAADDMLSLLRWLDADKGPVLAQLPRRDFERLRSAWRLPD